MPDPTSEAPPRGGPGSDRDAWAAYAASLGVDVPDGATRDDIITAVDARPKGHVDGEPAPLDHYPARPYHEAVDPDAFPDGVPVEAQPPSEEPTDA